MKPLMAHSVPNDFTRNQNEAIENEISDVKVEETQDKEEIVVEKV